MVAGGLTFAIPSALPQAAADPATDGALTVSSTEFGGQQIIEIRINDPDLRSVADDHGTLDVTIDGESVHMVQASTGIWYAYAADNSAQGAVDDLGALTNTDNNPLITTVALLDAATGQDGIAQGSNAVAIYPVTLDNAPNFGGASNTGTLSPTNWPHVQLFEFDNAGETLDVVYDTDSVSVEFDDDLTGSASIALDRTDVPGGATVHVTISDTRLNLDPTGNDAWTFNVTAGTAAYGDGTTATDLGDDGHGDLDITAPLDVTDRADPPVTSDTITFEESARNSGEFESSADDESPITLNSEADINSRVTVSYAGADATLIVRDESTDISITSDDFWNSGEPATVTVEAPNLNLNTQTDDHVTIDSELIPTIMVGDPITIADFDFSKAEIAYNDADATHTSIDGNNTPLTVGDADTG